jgi:prepilin-type N-terminal cleavage/methylation domain-containing protein
VVGCGAGILAFLFDKCPKLKQNELVRTDNRGFTLIELILVMAIIAILAVVGIGSYTQATLKARDTQRKNDLNQIAKALESFNNEVGRYPLDDDNGNMTCPDYANGSLVEASCYGSITADIGDSNKVVANKVYTEAVFMEKLPIDPTLGKRYIYEKTSSGFSLYMAIENPEDRDVVVDDLGNKTTWDIDCGSVECNYKLSETGLIRIKD